MGRNNFLTFLFGLIPGAGQMYLGLMKKGICIMLLFGVISTLSHLLPFNFIGFILPVIWFYAFFDTLFLSRVTSEERTIDEENFIDKIKQLSGKDWRTFCIKYRVIISGLIILMGIQVLFNSFLLPFMYRFMGHYGTFYSLISNIPNLVVGILLFIGGFYVLAHFKAKENQ